MNDENKKLNISEELNRAEKAYRSAILHFVKTGVFDTDASHVFSKMMKFREEADYNPSYSFTGGDFTDFKEEVAIITRQIKDYLTQQNLL